MGNMLIHITPRLLKPSSVGLTCGLIDVEVPELGLMLKEGRELVARTPYPNKRYLVASRKQGLKAIVGLFSYSGPAIAKAYDWVTATLSGSELGA